MYGSLIALQAAVSASVPGPRGSCPLLFAHFLERQSSTDRDYIEYGMRRVGRHAQLMNPFPRSNADLRRIEIGALLGQLLPSLFGALKLLVSQAFRWSLYQVAGARRRHVSSVQLSSDAGRLGGRHRIARDPGPR